MKKKNVFFLSLILALTMLSSLFTGCTSKSNSSLQKVKLNEVTRSIFYAPFYAAVNEGFFKEEGLEIDLTTGEGADATRPNTQVEN